MLDRYLPFKVAKVYDRNEQIGRFVCGECNKGFYQSRAVIQHQRQECEVFREKNPGVLTYEVNLSRGRPKKDLSMSFKREKEEMEQQPNPEVDMSENVKNHSKIQKSSYSYSKPPRKQPSSSSSSTQIPSLQPTLLIDPLPNNPNPRHKILSPGDLVSNYRNCLFKSFSILTLGRQKFHIQQFQELLSTYRFERYEGVSFGEVKESYFEYVERAKSTITELLKLHANKKQRFVMVMGQNMLLVDFFWRKDEPEIILSSKQKAFQEKEPYIELLHIQKSKLFKVLDIVCIHAHGMAEVREVWEKVLKLINMNIPFTAVSNYPFENSFKAFPVIKQEPEQVTKDYYQFFNILNPSKPIYRQKVLGFTTASNLYAFCMSIMDRCKCLIEVEFADMSEITQRIWNSSQTNKKL